MAKRVGEGTDLFGFELKVLALGELPLFFGGVDRFESDVVQCCPSEIGSDCIVPERDQRSDLMNFDGLLGLVGSKGQPLTLS